MAKHKRLVILGLLGPVLDSGNGPDRWSRWRPTVSLGQHEDLLVHRFELLHEPAFTSLAKTVGNDLAAVSPETTVRPHVIRFTPDPWNFEGVYAALHDFASNYPFKPDEEEYLVHISTGTHVAQICLFLLTESRRIPARLVQSTPPDRRKSVEAGFDIVDLDLSRYDRLASRFALEAKQSTSFLKNGIATRNAQFNRLIDRIEQVAVASASPILLTGPTGAGKSQLARKIFELKKARRRITGTFVEVNCATLRGDAAMSALFGHTRGAFTGAVGERPGLLRAADGGVLFLDEIAELGLDEQAMLLRAIEEKRFLPVGSDKEAASDFQLIAGTNRDLRAAVAERAFREDLLARIDLWTFALPPLCQRREDIEPNLDFELERFAVRAGTKVTFNKESRHAFLAFATAPTTRWPGNFRDLNAAVTRMATLAPAGRITADVVADEIARLNSAWSGGSGAHDAGDPVAHALSPAAAARLDRFDRVQLAEVLRVCRASKSLSEAGRSLFDVSRTKKESPNDADRLRKYLARWGLDFKSVASD